jgi:hypothetical protein
MPIAMLTTQRWVAMTIMAMGRAWQEFARTEISRIYRGHRIGLRSPTESNLSRYIPPTGQNQHELLGAITAGSIARIELEASQRKRVVLPPHKHRRGHAPRWPTNLMVGRTRSALQRGGGGSWSTPPDLCLCRQYSRSTQPHRVFERKRHRRNRIACACLECTRRGCLHEQS